jgi:HEAT repeat protein
VRRQFLLFVLAVAALGLLGWVIISRYAPAPPVYGGKTVKAWALQYGASKPTNRAAAGRAEAASALKALGSNAVPALVKLLGSSDSILRRAVWSHAGQLPAPLERFITRNIRPLEAAELQRAAARALGLIGPEAAAATPALSRALRAKEADVRYEAGLALGRIGGSGVDKLAAELTAPDPNVRYPAVVGLGEAQADLNLAVLALLEGLEDPHDGVRVAAGGSLSKLGTNVLPLVIRELESGTPARRRAAARAVGIVRTDRANVLPGLMKLARDPDPGLRLAGIGALGGQGLPSDRMIEAFSNALTDSVPEVRLAALYPLVQLGGRAAPAVPNLTACLSDPSATVRLWAARTLGGIGSPARPAVGALTGLAADPDVSVQAAATQALASIRDAPVSETPPDDDASGNNF